MTPIFPRSLKLFGLGLFALLLLPLSAAGIARASSTGRASAISASFSGAALPGSNPGLHAGEPGPFLPRPYADAVLHQRRRRDFSQVRRGVGRLDSLPHR